MSGASPPSRAPAMRICSELGTDFHGAVRTNRLLAAGLTAAQIKQLVRAGALHRRHHGVYIVGHLALAPLAREAAAVLACGPGAVISHWSAAHLLGLVEPRPSVVEVTVIGGRCRRQEGLRAHQLAALAPSDIKRQQRIPLTSAARTIVDLAAEASGVRLERLIAEARAKRLVRDGEIEAALDRAGNQKGVARLRAILKSEAGRSMTRSETERRCRRLLKAAGLPQPTTNQRVAGCEVDFCWPRHRVVLEVDTITFHGHPRAFEWDRRKTLTLEDAGYHVIRVTRRQLEEEPLWVIAHIARALERYRPAAA